MLIWFLIDKTQLKKFVSRYLKKDYTKLHFLDLINSFILYVFSFLAVSTDIGNIYILYVTKKSRRFSIVYVFVILFVLRKKK